MLNKCSVMTEPDIKYKHFIIFVSYKIIIMKLFFILRISNFTKPLAMAGAITFLTLSSFNSKAQEFNQEYDYLTKLPIMDVFSQPNIHIAEGRNKLDYYGSGDVNNDEVRDETDVQLIRAGGLEGLEKERADVSGEGELNEQDAQILEDYINGNRNYLPGNWNELNFVENRREKRFDWIDKRVRESAYLVTPYKYPEGETPDCTLNSHLYFFNFTGVENFENYEGFNDNWPGNDTKEGYDFYSLYVDNAKENIPCFNLGAKTKSIGNHMMPSFFVGPENDVEEDNPLDFTQWVTFNPNNQSWIISEDIYTNENDFASFRTIYYDEKENTHKKDYSFLFSFTKGVARYEEKGYNQKILRQNPHHLNLNLTLEDTVSSTIDLGDEPVFSEVLYETNADPEHTEIGLTEKIDTSWLNEVEYDLIKTTSGKINQECFFFVERPPEETFFFENYGRHVIADTIKNGDTIHVRDLSPPEFNDIPEHIGYNTEGKEITPENFGWPETTDNSGIAPELNYLNTEVISENEDSIVYQMNIGATDWKGQSSTGYKEIVEEKDITPPRMDKFNNGRPVEVNYHADGSNLHPDVIGWPTGTDDSGEPVDVTFNGYRLYKEEDNINYYYLDYTFTDWAGNSKDYVVRVESDKTNSSKTLEELTETKYYPNPVDNILNVEYSPKLGKLNYEVYSTDGKKVLDMNDFGNFNDGKGEIDLSQLKPGMYIVGLVFVDNEKSVMTDYITVTKR